MGGGSGSSTQSSNQSGWSKSESHVEIPAELKPLYTQSAQNMQTLQNLAPLWGTQQTTVKQGATPTATNYQYIPGTPAASSAPLMFQDPITGQLYGSGGVTGLGENYYANNQPGVDPNAAPMGFGQVVGTPVQPYGSAAYPDGDLYRDAQGRVLNLDASKVTYDGNTGVYKENATGNIVQRYTPPPGSAGAAGGQSAGGGGTPGYYDYSKPIFTYAPEDYETTQLTPNYLASNPMGVAGADPLQTWAASHITDLLNTPQGEQTASMYGLLAPILAGRMATGAGVESDPAVLAASQAFEKLLAPGIENQMGLAGLGKSSSLANSLAMSKTQYMLPLIQDYITREQNTMNQQAQMYGSLMPQFAGIGAAETQRLTAALNDAAQMGGTMRGITQEPLTAAYQDFLRRQALAEQALFVPFGAMASASIGPKATSESEQKGTSSGEMSQGMFK